ncbi:MAG: YdeI/OmpD-associated family protein [Pseudomonadota bacterium]
MWAYPFEITVPVIRRHMGKALYYTVVELPDGLDLPFDNAPRLRVEGEIEGRAFEGTWMPGGGGPHYLMTPAKMLKRIGKAVGDTVTIRFAIADQSAVREPPELTEALADLPDLRAVWDGWTPGKRRGHVHRIASAKAAATRARRVGEVLDLLSGG